MAAPSPQSAGLLLTIMLAVAVAPAEAPAQDVYPSRVIRVIVPTAPGGGSDTVARLIGQGLFERLGRQVVVENRAGAGTVIGSELVAKAPPDGYTLLLGTPPLTINPALFRKLPFDALRDFAPIALAATAPSVLIVHPSVPVKSVKEMIALAKARPGEILFGSGGLGTHSHLAIVLFAAMAQIRMLHVPYKSGAPSLIDLMAGNIALTASGVFTAMPYVRAGRVRVLGVTSASRVPMVPEIPTVAEAGVPGYESVQWYGLLAPAGTPRDIVGRLNRETVAVLRTPSNRERITADGADVVAGTPEEFAGFLRTETVKWAKVVRIAGIQPE